MLSGRWDRGDQHSENCMSERTTRRHTVLLPTIKDKEIDEEVGKRTSNKYISYKTTTKLAFRIRFRKIATDNEKKQDTYFCYKYAEGLTLPTCEGL